MRPSFFSIILAIAAAPHCFARFNQENPPVERKLETFGDANDLDGTISGQIATFSGRIPHTLLGKADPCDQARLADKMIIYGNKHIRNASIRAKYNVLVQRFMAAEKNFDPTKAPSFCTNPSLPRQALLRGILPKVDPSRGRLRNSVSAKEVNDKTNDRLRLCAYDSKKCARLAKNKSIASQMKAMGFTDFKGSKGV